MNLSAYKEKYDSQNQFNVLVETYKQIDAVWNNEIDVEKLKNKKFRNIVVSGLGGSAISGDLIGNFLKDELGLPFFVNRNYTLPRFVDRNTLLVISSYSGNTEETISVMGEGVKQKCPMICITTGGKVLEIAEENKYR